MIEKIKDFKKRKEEKLEEYLEYFKSISKIGLKFDDIIIPLDGNKILKIRVNPFYGCRIVLEIILIKKGFGKKKELSKIRLEDGFWLCTGKNTYAGFNEWNNKTCEEVFSLLDLCIEHNVKNLILSNILNDMSFLDDSVKVCESCKKEIDPQARFCSFCGQTVLIGIKYDMGDMRIGTKKTDDRFGDMGTKKEENIIRGCIYCRYSRRYNIETLSCPYGGVACINSNKFKKFEPVERKCRTCKLSREYNNASVDCDDVIGHCYSYEKWRPKNL